MEMTDLQKTAFEKFKKLKVGAIFTKMGTGKTKMALDLIKYNKGRYDTVLWLAPCSTLENLKAEVKKQGFDGNIVYCGWETLSMSKKVYLDLLQGLEGCKLFVVADESSYIKNDQTKRHERAIKLSKNSEYRLLLNATPITRNEYDLYHQFNFLSPKIFNMNVFEFRNIFMKEIEIKKKGSRPRVFYKMSDVNLDLYQDIINPYLILGDLDLDIQEKTRVRYTTPTDSTIEDYEECADFEELFKIGDKIEIIKLLQKLNAISSKDEYKAKVIAEEQKGKQVIIFCNYIDEVNTIVDHIEDCYSITGATKVDDRSRIIEEFKNDTKPLVMTLGTGAYGLNLQFCNTIVFSSLTFDYAKVLQAEGRIKRLGQTEDVTYIYYDTDLPINKFIGSNISKKSNLVDTLIKNIK